MKTPPYGGVFMMVSISGILFYVVIYLGPMLPLGSSGTSASSADTALQTRKYFAVSPELNRFVTVRNSHLSVEGRYPLRLPLKAFCPDFPLLVRYNLTTKATNSYYSIPLLL